MVLYSTRTQATTIFRLLSPFKHKQAPPAGGVFSSCQATRKKRRILKMLRAVRAVDCRDQVSRINVADNLRGCQREP